MTASSTQPGEIPSKMLDFAQEVKKWRDQTIFHSNTALIVENEHFKNIEDMLRTDWNAVSEAIGMLREEPSHLIWAFNKVFGLAASLDPNHPDSSGRYYTLDAVCNAFVEAYDNGILRKMWDRLKQFRKEDQNEKLDD